MAHLVSAPLLQHTTAKHYHTHSHNYYVPLTDQQADVFMRGQKYTNYVNQKLKCLYYYIDLNDKVQRKFKRDKVTRSTELEIKHLQASKLEVIEAQDKQILMTEGIGGLPPARELSYENSLLAGYQRSTDECEKTMAILCCLPCFIKQCCCGFEGGKYPKHLAIGRVLKFF